MAPSTQQAKTIQIPALGRPILIGELYDARTSQFLKQQILPNDIIEKAVSPVPAKYSKIDVSMANTFESKSNVVNISAELSVDVLGGLVSLSGSGSYLKDTKANTTERTWAMSLLARTSEARLNIVDSMWKDLIEWDDPGNTATHFVSSITYGGSAIVNLVSRKSDSSNDTTINGSFSLQLKKLGDAVDVTGSAKGNYKDLNLNITDEFDLSTSTDFTPDGPYPMTPDQILTWFPKVYKLVVDSKPNVDAKPVSVTLQPIPKSIRKNAVIIYCLEQKKLDTILKVFGNLDDIRSRFDSLQQKAAAYGSFLPRFISVLKTAEDTFNETCEPFVEELGNYLNASRSDAAEPDNTFIGKAEALFNQHNQGAAGYTPPTYEVVGGAILKDKVPKPNAVPLTVLEQAYDDFQRFIAVLNGLNQKPNALDDVINAAIEVHDMALFVMPPMGTSTTGNLMRFKKLVLSGKTLYSTLKTTIPMSFLYLEDPAALRSTFPGMDLATIDSPVLIRGTKNDSSDGTMSWVTVPHVSPLCRFNLNFSQNEEIVSDDQLLEDFDCNGSFTIMAKATWSPDDHQSPPPNDLGAFPVLFQIINDKDEPLIVFECYQSVITAAIAGSKNDWIGLRPSDKPGASVELGKPFSTALVRDAVARRWLLYFNNTEVYDHPVDKDVKWSGKLFIRLGTANPLDSQAPKWSGRVENIQIHTGVLTEKSMGQILNSSGKSVTTPDSILKAA